MRDILLYSKRTLEIFVMFRLKKVDGGEKKEKADPMMEMLQRIRSGNVALKKVSPTPERANKGGGVMAEMAKLLASNKNKKRTAIDIPRKDPQPQNNQMSNELFNMFKKRRGLQSEPAYTHLLPSNTHSNTPPSPTLTNI